MFVGSMNLDPRSKNLNSEMGVVLKNSLLAPISAEQLIQNLPLVAYRLELNKKKIQWIEQLPEGEKIHKKEPGLTWWKNFKTGFSSTIMSEDLL
jgi:putative cardiolipin synthase